MEQTKTSEIEFKWGPWDGKVVEVTGLPDFWVCVVNWLVDPRPYPASRQHAGRPFKTIEHFYQLIGGFNGRPMRYVYQGYKHPRIAS